MMKWDFFIAHAGPDAGVAEELYGRLEAKSRVFLDSQSLKLGDNWDVELPKAQAESLVSVILVSSNTEKAYYQREEIAAAINMARDDPVDHRVVPVYLDATATKSAPYGLRLKHGLMLTGAVDISRAADELLRLLTQLQGGDIRVLDQASDMVMPECPYMGLAHFNIEDQDLFFGRETFTSKLYEAFYDKPLVAVVGPSGSGKSSVVRAGFMPKLKREGFDQAGGAGSIAVMLPRDKPFHELAATLMPLIEPDISKLDRLRKSKELANDFREGKLELAEVVGLIQEGSQHDQRLVLIIDQFEELFTLTAEKVTQARFLDLIIHAIKDSNAGLKVILTLRADFWGQALSYRPFLDVLEDADVKLGLMNREELRSAIESPAMLRGVSFEPGLTERILDDVGRDAGNLPLLEFALTQLWTLQDSAIITHAAYDQIGGISGALTSYADEILDDLRPAEQERARRVLVQMVKSGEGTQDTRRLARRDDFVDEDWQLARRLADMRLLVTGSDPETVEETAEVVHEALIQNWGRLKGWMESDREFRTWQDRMRLSLDQWEKSGQKSSALLTGLPLQEAKKWRIERQDELSEIERAYIHKSIRKYNILWGAGILAVTAVIIILSLLVFWANKQAKIARNAQEDAQIQAEKANRQAQISDAQRLMAESHLISDEKPLTGLQLAIEGLERLPTDENAFRGDIEKTIRELAQQGRISLLGTEIEDAILIIDDSYILTGVTTTLRTSRDPKGFIPLGGEVERVYPIPDNPNFVVDFRYQEDGLYSIQHPDSPLLLGGEVERAYPIPGSPNFVIDFRVQEDALFSIDTSQIPIPLGGAVDRVHSIPDSPNFVVDFVDQEGALFSTDPSQIPIAIGGVVDNVLLIPDSPYFVVDFVDQEGALFSTDPSHSPTRLGGIVDNIFSISGGLFFVVDFRDQEDALYSIQQLETSLSLGGEVERAYAIPDSPFFVIDFVDQEDALYSTDLSQNPTILAGEVNQVYPIPDSEYFVINFADQVDVLYSTDLSQNPIPLDGDVYQVLPIPGSRYFVIKFSDREHALYSTDLSQRPIRLGGEVTFVNKFPGSQYFVIFYSGKNELWDRAGKRLLNLGFGVHHVIRTNDDRLVVTYLDKRAYLLDLTWISAMGGEADPKDMEALKNIICDGPLSWGLVDQAILNEKLQGSPPQACKQ